MFPAPLLVSAISLGLTICGTASLCLSCSIFDFIVMREMYYTVPDTKVLIPTEMSWWFYGTSILCVLLSALTIMASTSSRTIQRFAEDNPQIFCFLHGGLLCASSILCAFCTYLAMQTAANVGKYAFHAHPKQFQDASHWYYTRLRASAVLFTIECLLQLLVLCVLYLGIQCRYRTFKQLPQKPDIVLRGGTMFA
nr:Protein F57B1.6, isoform a [Haemonchus contortus]